MEQLIVLNQLNLKYSSKIKNLKFHSTHSITLTISWLHARLTLLLSPSLDSTLGTLATLWPLYSHVVVQSVFSHFLVQHFALSLCLTWFTPLHGGSKCVLTLSRMVVHALTLSLSWCIHMFVSCLWFSLICVLLFNFVDIFFIYGLVFYSVFDLFVSFFSSFIFVYLYICALVLDDC